MYEAGPTLPPDSWLGTVLAETYSIIRVLGQGGMGTVYEARHTRLPRSFAIKVLRSDIFRDHKTLARFQREAEIACQLKHRHIVEVLDYNTTSEGQPYIVMELLEGEDLTSRFSRCARLSLVDAVSIANQTATALAAAHAQGVVHRDLKPQNIFLCRQADRDDYVKVLDFGISKLLGRTSSLTREEAIIGTPWYMAPEQAAGKARDIDHRADLFALGAIVFEALAGMPPFAGDTPVVALHNVIYEEPASLIEANPEVPSAVDAVIRRALAKRPEERYQSADQFARALTEAAAVSIEVTGPLSRVSTDGLSITGPPARPKRSVATPSMADRRAVALHPTTPLAAEIQPAARAGSRQRWLLVAAPLAIICAAGVILVLVVGRRGQPAAGTLHPAQQHDSRTGAAVAKPPTPLDAGGTPAASPDQSVPSVKKTRSRPPRRKQRVVAPRRRSPDAGPIAREPKPVSVKPPPKVESKTTKASPKPKVAEPPRKDWILKPKIE